MVKPRQKGGWPQALGGGGAAVERALSFPREDEETSGEGCWRRLQNSLNVLNATESYI